MGRWHTLLHFVVAPGDSSLGEEKRKLRGETVAVNHILNKRLKPLSCEFGGGGGGGGAGGGGTH